MTWLHNRFTRTPATVAATLYNTHCTVNLPLQDQNANSRTTVHTPPSHNRIDVERTPTIRTNAVPQCGSRYHGDQSRDNSATLQKSPRFLHKSSCTAPANAKQALTEIAAAAKDNERDSSATLRSMVSTKKHQRMHNGTNKRARSNAVALPSARVACTHHTPRQDNSIESTPTQT